MHGHMFVEGADVGYRKFRVKQPKPPEHEVTITYHADTHNFTVRCSACGYLGTPKKTWAQAMNRKSTHERGQDAGGES